MILHLVQFRLDDGVAVEDARVQALHQALLELPGKVPGILSWQCGFNTTPDAAAWDYALSAAFASRADLLAYFEHPAHTVLLPEWGAVAELAFVDLES